MRIFPNLSTDPGAFSQIRHSKSRSISNIATAFSDISLPGRFPLQPGTGIVSSPVSLHPYAF
jgi:hypothetical protein